MNRHKVVGLLLAVMLAVGSFALAPVPVAQATTLMVNSFNNAPTKILVSVASGYIMVGFLNDSTGWAGSGASMDQKLTASYDGTPLAGNICSVLYDVWGDSAWKGLVFTIVGGDSSGANHTISSPGGTFYYGVDNYYQVVVPAFTWTGRLTDTAGAWVDISGYVAEPLSVSIEGPASVDTTDTNTWHATATGGTGPYTYAWDYGVIGPFFLYGSGTGDTFTKLLTSGNWTIAVRATDSLGATAYDDIVVSAASIAGSYQAHLTRSGSYGQYMSVYVTDAAGAYVTISSTANTQFGIYATAGGAFGWVAADSEAVQYVTYTWRWTMSANFGGATSPPPADFWFQSSVHLAIPNLNLLVMHHFTGTSEIIDPWFPPGPPGTDVDPVIPETPPAPTTTLPDWLTPLWDFLVKLFKALFQPDATEFGKQLSGSWVTIASPVPAITPQYTIPFPNPQHLLAPTGDSVNIDFSGIMSYTGYSTYKTIVQVVLDAILLFVVISIIT